MSGRQVKSMLEDIKRTPRRETALTICSLNYLSKAMVLIDSYLDHHPEQTFHLVIVDKKTNISFIDSDRVNILWVEELGIPNFLAYAFMYDVIELNTNVKPFVLAKLLRKYDSVLYLDPDIKIYESLSDIFLTLHTSSFVLTPHYITPINDGHSPGDIELLKFGAFNLGFIGVSKCDETDLFLNWWSDRCLSDGFYEPQLGLAVDQKWVGLAPSFFRDFKVLDDKGLNLAFWNLHEREITKDKKGWVVNGETRLKFIHFSSFDSNNPSAIAMKQNRFPPGSRPDFIELAEGYAKDLLIKSSGFNSTEKYAFDYFDNGMVINSALRRFYAGLYDKKFSNTSNPFNSKAGVFKFAKKQRLLSGNTKSPRHTFKSMGQIRHQIKFINILLRCVLYVVGPDRYFNLMRYLAHISSIRKQADLFGRQDES